MSNSKEIRVYFRVGENIKIFMTVGGISAQKLALKKKSAQLAAAFPNGVRCQKCLEFGHWSYECKGKRKFLHRTSRTKQLNKNLEKKRIKDVELKPPKNKRRKFDNDSSNDGSSSSSDTSSDSDSDSSSESESSESSDDSSDSSSSSSSDDSSSDDSSTSSDSEN